MEAYDAHEFVKFWSMRTTHPSKVCVTLANLYYNILKKTILEIMSPLI